VIHSRQKRERRKAEAEELKNQVLVLKQNHRELTTENTRLETLMMDVKRKIGLPEQATTAPVTAASFLSGVMQQSAGGEPQFLAAQLPGGGLYGGYTPASSQPGGGAVAGFTSGSSSDPSFSFLSNPNGYPGQP